MTHLTITQFAATLPFQLDDFQIEAMEKWHEHRGVIVSAPTSSGKTVVADYAVWLCMQMADKSQPYRVIYTTPLKALSNQKYHEFCERYGEDSVGLVTGENTIHDDAPVVIMTTEILRNVMYDSPLRLADVDAVVLDEVHYIDDFPRGAVWEEVIIQAPPHIRFIGLSATISNIEQVAAWMQTLRGSMATVIRTKRPVELKLWLSINNQLHPLFDENGHAHRETLAMAQNDAMMDRKLQYAQRTPDNDVLSVIKNLATIEIIPAIYFIFSRRGCREALARCVLHHIDLTTDAEKKAIDAEYESRLEQLVDSDEQQLFVDAMPKDVLRRGIAMHHAGMLPYAKEAVEGLFAGGFIKCVFATETLALGLNMPARACVISTFTKFDGTGFHTITSTELAQLLGRAGRRGIDTIGHGVILKENDVDVAEIYDAAMGTEMTVSSKFAPTYTMTLNLLHLYSVHQAEQLMERSFGQYQTVEAKKHWHQREANLITRRADLQQRVFRHPRVRCNEQTISTYLRTENNIEELQRQIRRAKRDHWRQKRQYGRASDIGQRHEADRRRVKSLRQKQNQSPCRGCPYFNDHRDNHREIAAISITLRDAAAELEVAQHRYRAEFTAYRSVLSALEFLHDDTPTPRGKLAGALYGDNALCVAYAMEKSWFEGMRPEELAASLVMLVSEDRGPLRRGRRRFPSHGVEQIFRQLRGFLIHLSSLEEKNGIQTVRPLSTDYVEAAFHWTIGTPLIDIEPPDGADIGDVVKAVKNVYSMLRQMEQVVREDGLLKLVRRTREKVERDLIRRV